MKLPKYNDAGFYQAIQDHLKDWSGLSDPEIDGSFEDRYGDLAYWSANEKGWGTRVVIGFCSLPFLGVENPLDRPYLKFPHIRILAFLDGMQTLEDVSWDVEEYQKYQDDLEIARDLALHLSKMPCLINDVPWYGFGLPPGVEEHLRRIEEEIGLSLMGINNMVATYRLAGEYQLKVPLVGIKGTFYERIKGWFPYVYLPGPSNKQVWSDGDSFEAQVQVASKSRDLWHLYRRVFGIK